jgi:serine/threonine-protein kinase
MGTPAYMSPEQCRALGSVDGRTDLYAAAVILYESLTGRVPFIAESAVEIMTKQINAPVVRPSRLTPVTPAIEAVVMKGLAKAAEDRFPTAEAMLEALEDACGHVTDSPPRSGRTVRRQSGKPTVPAEVSPAPAGGTLKSIAPVATPEPLAAVAPGRRWRRWPVVGIAVPAVAAICAILLLRGREPPAPPVPARPAAAIRPAAYADEAARAYLDEA